MKLKCVTRMVNNLDSIPLSFRARLNQQQLHERDLVYHSYPDDSR